MEEPVVKVTGVEYRIGRLDAWAQLHVARKVGPLYATVLQSGSAAVRGEISVQALLLPVATGFSALSKEDTEYVVKTCLGVCTRKQLIEDQEMWARVVSNGKIMFDDIGADEMYLLPLEVIRVNLANFFQGVLRQFSASQNKDNPSS